MNDLDLDTKAGMAQACAWQEQLCSMLQDGGSWGIPRSEAVYVVYPSDKAYRAKVNEDEQVERVFKEMGWAKWAK
jgi:hypothetical protein